MQNHEYKTCFLPPASKSSPGLLYVTPDYEKNGRRQLSREPSVEKSVIINKYNDYCAYGVVEYKHVLVFREM